MGWSNKYKKSIDCNNPKGFSQKAHCQGRKKRKENIKNNTIKNAYIAIQNAHIIIKNAQITTISANNKSRKPQQNGFFAGWRLP